MAAALLEMMLSLLRRELRIAVSCSEAESFISPYLSSIASILRCTSGKEHTGEASCLSFGYIPSLTLWKKWSRRRIVSVTVFSFPRESRSMHDPALVRPSRKGRASM